MPFGLKSIGGCILWFKITLCGMWALGVALIPLLVLYKGGSGRNNISSLHLLIVIYK